MSVKSKIDFNIQFNDLNAQWQVIKESALERIDQLFERSYFIGGKDIALFESNYADWNQTKYAIGCSNGTDAIKLALMGMDLQGSVSFYIPANTFVATIAAAEHAYPEASMHLIDCDKHFQIDMDILEESLKSNRDKSKNAVIIPVHLYGHTVNIKKVKELAKAYDCIILEDSSQAHGARGEDGVLAGSFGRASAFSLYPGKNLGAAGDAGVISTNDTSINDRVRALRNLGSEKKYYHDYKGFNNRLDNFQAIIVDEKLKHIDNWNDMRNEVIKKYETQIKHEHVMLPSKANYCEKHVYHIYCVRITNGKREDFQNYLKNNGVTTVIHYPIPIEETKAYSYLNVYNKNTRDWASEIISLPIHPFLKDHEIEHISSVVNNWEV